VPLVLALLVPGLAAAQGADPDTVARAYEAARTSGDLDALMSVFADDATVTYRLGYKHAGTDEIRRLLHLATSRGRALAITERLVSGDHVFWVEQEAKPDLNFAFAVEAVVKGGRITSLEYRDGGPQELGAEQPAPGTLLPPSLGLALPLLVLMVAVMILSAQPVTGGRRRPRTRPPARCESRPAERPHGGRLRTRARCHLPETVVRSSTPRALKA
jgi:ketosteroid isomerase-like protein